MSAETESGPCQQNLERMKVGNFIEDDSSFCLLELRSHDADDPELREKKADLLAGRIEISDKDRVISACNLGSCTLKLTENLHNGTITSIGKCVENRLCLRQRIEAVKAAPTDAEGSEIYKTVLDDFGLVVGGGQAGTFCPRLDCEYSFGCSEDRVYNSCGSCDRPEAQRQMTFDDYIVPNE